jgi:hypothetical protein
MSGLEILGISAAAVQFADVGWKVFLGLSRLASDLNHVPEKIQQAAKRVEQLVTLSKVIKADASKYSTCPHDEPHPLQRILKDCAILADQLQLILDSVTPTGKENRIRKSWKAVVGVKKEREIMEKCRVLEDFKLSLSTWIVRENLQETNTLNTTTVDLLSAVQQMDQSTRDSTSRAEHQLARIEGMILSLIVRSPLPIHNPQSRVKIRTNPVRLCSI